MKIGIFDSGLGGLVVTKAIISRLPKYDILYLGDTKRVPYGNRSQQTIYDFTVQAVKFLFAQNCQLVILACNTASAQALRKIQQELLPQAFPGKRVLGVVIPTLEAVSQNPQAKKVGVLATESTASSHIYRAELKKLNPKLKVLETAAPLLVPIIENNAEKFAEPFLKEYLKPILKFQSDSLVLGCTHYPILKKQIKQLLPKKVKIYSQEEIIPEKLENYLKRHPEIESKLSKKGSHEFMATDLNVSLEAAAKKLFGKKIPFKLAVY